MSCVFGKPITGREEAHILRQLRQGRYKVFDHAIKFQSLTAESHWNDDSLADNFYPSLSKEIKDRLATADLMSSFGLWRIWSLRLITFCRSRSDSTDPWSIRHSGL